MKKSTIFSITLIILLTFSHSESITLTPTINVLSPIDADIIYIGDISTIKWEVAAISSENAIRIELVDNNGVKTIIASSIPNTGIFDWRIDNNIEPNAYHITITNIVSGDYGDSGKFDIKSRNSTSNVFLSPVKNQNVTIGTNLSINMNTTKFIGWGEFLDIQIELLRDDPYIDEGNTFTNNSLFTHDLLPITKNPIAQSASVSWYVSGVNPNQFARIIIIDTMGNIAFSEPFYIIGLDFFNIISPNHKSICSNNTIQVSWLNFGYGTINVIITNTTDQFEVYGFADNSGQVIFNAGSFSPGEYQILMQYSGSSTISGISEVFLYSPIHMLEVLSPEDGSNIPYNYNISIAWRSNTSFTAFNIDLYLSDGITHVDNIATDVSLSHFIWNTTNYVGEFVIRVTNKNTSFNDDTYFIIDTPPTTNSTTSSSTNSSATTTTSPTTSTKSPTDKSSIDTNTPSDGTTNTTNNSVSNSDTNQNPAFNLPFNAFYMTAAIVTITFIKKNKNNNLKVYDHAK